MKTFALTHIGLNKEKNEDRYLIKRINNGSILFAVADGMGGEAAGEYAAKILLNKMAGVQQNSILNEQQLSLLVKEADRAVFNEADKNSTLEGMGTTLTGALLRNGTLHWSHVGDSRLYVMQQNELRQITKDQNMAQFLFEEGEISAEEVNVHPSRNQLDQCVGCGECIPDMGQLAVNVGDMLILTTDGLHAELTFGELYAVLNSTADIETKAKLLIKTVSDSSGKDDMTIVIAQF